MSTFNYHLKLSYSGKDFEGWQVQAEGHETVQGCLNRALKKISKSENVSTLGSGRTDTGVHALAQIVKVKIDLEISPENLKNALNSHLPKSIRILEARTCDDEFHPVAGAKWKRYDYLIAQSEILPPEKVGFLTHIPKDLDLDSLNSALTLLKGTRDFERFSTKGTPVKSTVRTIYEAKVTKEELLINPFSGENLTILRLTFVGNGFLKQMVRLLVGAALNVANGKSSLSEFENFLNSETEDKFGPVAPPDGLYLVHVEYDKDYSSLH